MMQKKRIVIALVLVICLVFSGCDGILDEIMNHMVGNSSIVAFRDMQYARPDMAELKELLQTACETAQNSKNLTQLMDHINAFYGAYDSFYTNYFLADIFYSRDLSDSYWESEYNYCLEHESEADAAMEDLYYALAASPMREELEAEEYFGAGFFDAYDGQSMWDETFLALMEQEASLQGKYYELSSQAQETEYYSEEYFSLYGTQMAELFVELVRVRQEIAAYAGYDSYPEFAYDMYHARDYTPAQAESYLLQIGELMYDIYCQVNNSAVWDLSYAYCSEEDTFQYVRTAAWNMGGYPRAAFDLLEKAGLYDIAYGETKMTGAFELYLWSYYEPFVFVSPYLDQSDKLTFSHEFGHFINDYVCYGSVAGTDVAEVHSQTMEYLSLLYGEDTEDLTAYKMADSLCLYVEQAAYALFEQQVYQLQGEELTAENVQALYEQIGTDFGFDSWAWDSRDFVTVNHFYTSPMYIISYVVSNDVAFQMYQLERETKGSGLEVYEKCLESMDSYLIAFAEGYGLESPFAPGRLETVLDTFTAELDRYL